MHQDGLELASQSRNPNPESKAHATSGFSTHQFCILCTFNDYFIDIAAVKRHLCSVDSPFSNFKDGEVRMLALQGPPGTGKTRTLLGLLSIILHAAPEGSIRAGTAKPVRVTGKRTAEDTVRLWKKANPWLMGITIPRQAAVTRLLSMSRGSFAT